MSDPHGAAPRAEPASEPASRSTVGIYEAPERRMAPVPLLIIVLVVVAIVVAVGFWLF